MREVEITVGAVTVRAHLNATSTATAILAALPIDATASVWGDEVYFDIGLALGTEQGQETVAMGDLGYWEPGQAFCIFYGLTPVSRGDEIRPYGPVTVFGHIVGDASVLKGTRSGARVRISAVAEAGAQ